MKKQSKTHLNFSPLTASSTRRQLLLSGLALALLGGKTSATQANMLQPKPHSQPTPSTTA